MVGGTGDCEEASFGVMDDNPGGDTEKRPVPDPKAAAGQMSVKAAPFVPGDTAQESELVKGLVVTRRKARERALQILSSCEAQDSSSAGHAHDTSERASSDSQATWWTMDSMDSGSYVEGEQDNGEGTTAEAGAQELRLDPADGLLYCKADFVLE